MNTLPMRAQAKRRGLNVPSVPASAVPTSTGATAAGSVRGRAATSQSLSGVRSGALRAALAEARVVGGDRQVADHVQHVAASDRVARHHRDDGLRQPPDLHVEVGDVEATDAALRGLVVAHVPGVAAHALVAAGAERVRSLAGQDDHADVEVLARALERVGHLDDRLRPERVPHLGPVDGDLRDALGGLVPDVLVVRRFLPVGRHGAPTIKPLDDWLSLRARTHGARTALAAGGRSLTYAELEEAAATVARRLAALGVGPGDRVATTLPPGVEFAALLHALPKLGAVLVPLNTRLTKEEMSRLLEEARPQTTVHRPLEGQEADVQ